MLPIDIKRWVLIRRARWGALGSCLKLIWLVYVVLFQGLWIAWLQSRTLHPRAIDVVGAITTKVFSLPDRQSKAGTTLRLL